jgi:hypothetical protein
MLSIFINDAEFPLDMTFQADDGVNGSILLESTKTGDRAVGANLTVALAGMADALRTRLNGFPVNHVPQKPPSPVR